MTEGGAHVRMGYPSDDHIAPPEPARRYLIVGAGPSGLAMAKAFKERGVEYDIVERFGGVGGIWDIDNPASPMYQNAHLISSSTVSGFDGYPMPQDFPDYPRHDDMLRYIRAFASHAGIAADIRFDVSVESIDAVNDRNGEAWDVVFTGGERHRYRGVVLATGHNWLPNTPAHPGNFDGQLLHSSQYKTPDVFDGRRVLIVGGGNSGCDIACDAAARADRTMLSLRRGYHFVPKHMFGVPTDVFARSGPVLPDWLARPVLTGILRLLVGDVTHYGLPKPTHRLLDSNPLVNTQVLHHIAHGDVSVKPDVRELDGKRVQFADDSDEDVDLIMYATGYKYGFPIAEKYVRWAPGTPQLFLNIFHPELHNLFVMGLFETDGAALPIFSAQADLVSQVVVAQARSGSAAERFHQLKTKPLDLSGGRKYLPTQRHSISVHRDLYMRELRRVAAEVQA